MAFSGGSDPVTFDDVSKAWNELDKERERNKKLLAAIVSMTNMAGNMSEATIPKLIYETGKAAIEENAK
ncbi:MAG TPA: hypothetical protein DDY18_05105 [Flavobacterium sp.]|jgi:hypothetical protein|nr:hypothetical protein [Flavobacterium sp.]